MDYETSNSTACPTAASPPGHTFANQHNLPKLPIPPLDATCKRYLTALRGLQDDKEHAATLRAVQAFLDGEGPKDRDEILSPRNTMVLYRSHHFFLPLLVSPFRSYIEEFWYENYLSHSDPLVLALNPFLVLENNPIADRSSQLPRAAALIISSLASAHDLRKGLLEPDTARGRTLDMDQYTRLFGTARIPTECGCKMVVNNAARHIVILRRGQFYWFDALDEENRPLLTEREVLHNLQAICKDADKIPITEAARMAIGVFTTENRKTWSSLRRDLSQDTANAACLRIVDDALFVVCLDDAAPGRDGVGAPSQNGENGEDLAALCNNFLCGTYQLHEGVQFQIIVCADGTAGINYEHAAIDGHTVLRFVSDVVADGLMRFVHLINPSGSAPTLFHAPLSPHPKSHKPLKSAPNDHTTKPLISSESLHGSCDTSPSKLMWTLTPAIRNGIRHAEMRLGDLICQSDCQALEFNGYGKNFIMSYNFSPDAFVQMAFQAVYFGLYGKTECTYEPVMMKAFLHGRTEGIRTVQPQSVDFTKTFFSECSPEEKIHKLCKACERHVQLIKECSQGLGQDSNNWLQTPESLPAIFADPGWSILNTSILCTSNNGNPALRLRGFGPIAAGGYGIACIIKENGISIVASSKHLQTRRFLDTLEEYLLEVQRTLIQLHRSSNECPAPFVDHVSVFHESKSGRQTNHRD
ncbi:acyltransferase ChoActase/COT/CPT [Rhizopogon salebrosus TDB-379]|nr:acyltransferase ChoActase/COT/CPT [Rhizopogon salebrosus TDB-379]